MRLIDADALNDVFVNVADHLEEKGRTDMAAMFRCAVGYVGTQPTVAEILRCKDCKHFKRNSGMTSVSPNGYCFNLNETMNACDFCSYGEKRKKEADK